MDIRKALLVQSLRELPAITACLSQSQQQVVETQVEKMRMSKTVPCVERISENFTVR